MINILYVTNSLSSYSETFIRNTVDILEKNNELNLVPVILSKRQFSSDILSLYIDSKKSFRFLLKILRIIRLTKIRNSLLYKYYDKKLRYVKFDIVWIDFGDNAISLSDYFNFTNKKVIAHLHGYDISKLLTNDTYRKRLVFFSQKNHIIVPSQYSRNRLYLGGCKSENLHVIPYSYHTKINEDLPNKTSVDYTTLLFVGRFVEKKDPRILVHVMQQVLVDHKNVKLVMIGDGPLFSEVEVLIEKLSLEGKIILLGALPHENVIEWLNKADIYVQHCVTAHDGDQEGYPNTILEAQLNGLPVVTTIHAGIPEIVFDGVSGFLVQEFDYLAMAQYIIKLIDNQELRIKMGKNARSLLREKSSPLMRGKKIMEVIQQSITSI